MSDTDEEDNKQLEYKDFLRNICEKASYYSDIEDASINLIEDLRIYLGRRGSLLYNKVNSSNFSVKIYEMIHEIIEKNK